MSKYKVNYRRDTYRHGADNAYRFRRSFSYENKANLAGQRKYFDFLVNLCIENGLMTEENRYTIGDRRDANKDIKQLQNKLREAGVEWNYSEVHKRYRFDRNGNVIDTVTRKVVEKRA